MSWPTGGDRGSGAALARAIAEAHRAIVAAPVLWARAHGFADVTPALLDAVLAIGDGGTDMARFRRDRGGSKQATSQLVAELCRRGYADLVASASDGRAKVVVLSPLGRDLRATCLEAERRLTDALVALVGGKAPVIVEGLVVLATGLEEHLGLGPEGDGEATGPRPERTARGAAGTDD